MMAKPGPDDVVEDVIKEVEDVKTKGVKEDSMAKAEIMEKVLEQKLDNIETEIAALEEKEVRVDHGNSHYEDLKITKDVGDKVK